MCVCVLWHCVCLCVCVRARAPLSITRTHTHTHTHTHTNCTRLQVASVVASGPADSSGSVMSGDILLTVDGISVEGFQRSDVLPLILGSAGSGITLGLLRLGAVVMVCVWCERDGGREKE